MTEETQNPAPDDFDKTETPGFSSTKTIIDKYTLLQPLGEGGMGEVWLADQSEPIKRRVALKIIKQGMDTKHVIARFEAERQALAMMNHPNIARVLDAGSTPEGRPYFVMEYVPGLPITEYCDKYKLTTKERLKLFQKVCSGIQHAHQKTIIHRDLKPSNILVTEQEGQAVPKIIDFGLVKATSQSLTDKTMVTQFGILMGTPEYMSPEQAEFSMEDIDIRTDVYSLGVVLYHLLTGVLPFASDSLRNAGLDGIRNVIRNQQPVRPSTRINSLGDQSEPTAERRKVNFRILHSELSGDLDWITMKTLEKDRSRRYSSVQSLSDDIERYLTDLPVTARPPSKLYELKRFSKRHRIAVIAALLILISLITGGTMSAIGFFQASKAQAQAEAEFMRAQKISGFLFSILEDADPFGSGSVELSVKDVILRALPRIDVELKDEYRMQGALRRRLGNVFFGFGDFEQSIGLLKQAVDDFDKHYGGLNEDSEWARLQLCWVIQKNGDYNETIKLSEIGAANSRKIWGPNSELEIRFIDVMGDTYRYMGDLAPAEQYLRQAHSMLDSLNKDATRQLDHDIELNIKNNLALVLRESGKLDEAESMFRAAYEKNLALFGELNNMTLLFQSNLGHTLVIAQKYDEAEKWLRRSIELRTRVMGADHPFTVMDIRGLARVLAVKDSLNKIE